MSEETATVSNTNNLLADVLKWKQRARELRAQLEAVTKERDEIHAAYSQLESDAGEIADAYEALDADTKANPSELQAKLDSLQKELWTRDKKSEFSKLANEAKVREEAHEDLWSLLGIDSEKDAECDQPCLQERIAEAVKARSYLLKSEPETGSGAAGAAQGQQQTGKPAIAAMPAGPGLSRGAPEPSAPNDPRAAAVERVQRATGQSNPFRVA